MMRAHYIRAYKEDVARDADKAKLNHTIQSVPVLDAARQSKIAQLQEQLDQVKSLEG